MLGFGSKNTRTQSRKRLGELLLEEGRLRPEDLKQALAQQNRNGGLLGEILVQSNLLEQDALLAFLMKLHESSAVSLSDYNVDEQAVSQIPEQVCEKHCLLPIDKLGRILTMAMVDPLDTQALEQAQSYCPDVRLKPLLCSWQDFQEVFKRIYGRVPQKPKGLENRYAHLDVAALTGQATGSEASTAPDALNEDTKLNAELDVLPLPGRSAGTPGESGVFETPDFEAEAAVADRPPRALYGMPLSSEDFSTGIRELARAVQHSIDDALGSLAASRTKQASGAESSPEQVTAAIQQALQNTVNVFADELRLEREALVVHLTSTQAGTPAETGPSVAEVAEIVGDRLNDSLRQMLEAVSGQTRQVGEALQELSRARTDAHPAAELGNTLKEAVADAARQSAAALTETLRQFLEAKEESASSGTPDPMRMAEAIRDGVSAVLSDALEAMSRQIQDQAERHQQHLAALPPPPDFEGVSKSLRDELAAGLDARLELLSQGVKSFLEQNGAAHDGHIEQLARAMRESILTAVASSEKAQAQQESRLAKIVESSLSAIAGNKDAGQGELARVAEAILSSIEHDKISQSEKQDQLAQIAQAALESVRQTAQLIEAHTVAENNRNDMMRQRERLHASVTPFNPGADPAPEYYAESDSRVREELDSERPLHTLTFQNFFSGESNAFVVNLAKAAAAAPGGEYNPLFLYGAVGLGKTHLVSAIGNDILARTAQDKKHPPARVGYLSASHFARRLAAAAADNSLELFRDNYCHWDVLILDDIQFLGGRVDAQEEFFHIFNVLLQSGRQIIIAGDKPPDKLGMLEQRLISRFASGIVVEVKAPEWETRMKILRHITQGAKTKVTDDILSLIALRVDNDIRKMIGALRKIIAYARLQGDTITMEEAQNILSHLNAHEAA
jgi:chromosomal replication initiator protein DnaA